MGGQEVELKLAIPPDSLPRLKRHPTVTRHRQNRPTSKRLHAIYYDTPDRLLATAGISVRVRACGRMWTQTVKTAGNRVSGLFSRQEWEAPVAKGDLDLTLLRQTGLDLLQDDAVLATLTPVFATSVVRTVYVLEDDQWQVELALDLGEITAGDRTERICEAELELRKGLPGDVFALARSLTQVVPARLLTRSKADRGNDLARGAIPTPVKASPVKLTSDMAVGEAFRAIARNCLHHLLANERALVERDDPEAIHQMRVALRRLRSAVKIFRKAIDAGSLRHAKEDVRWLLGLLGPARDAEVFLAEIIDPVVELRPNHTALSTLRTIWRDRRVADQAAARHAVVAPRFTALMLDLGAWIESDRPVAPPENGASLTAFSQATLRQLFRRMRKDAGEDLAALPHDDLHQVRIMGKQLRYAGEFFMSLYPQPQTREFLNELGQLQDVLGEINDIAVAIPRLATAHGDAGTAWAAGLVAGWHEARRPALIAQAQKIWKSLGRRSPFWKG